MIAAAQLNDIADRLFAAFVAHDLEVVEAMLTANALITQNGITSPVADALTNIAAIRHVIGDHRYEDVRRVVGDNAIVEEHQVRSTTPGGSPVDLAACVVVRVNDDGLITSLDEYVDISTFPQS